MMRYPDQLLSSPLKTSSTYKSSSPTPGSEGRRLTSAQDSKISLTPLWEYVVRTKSLPEGLDLDVFFHAIQDRLRNPEREVRQHALRVLTDFIPVIDKAVLDEKMQTVMPDLVANLGHIGPAVRKGSIDCLRAYLSNSSHADNILKDLVYDGLERAHENKMRTSIVVGIIIALPFLLQKATHEVFLYVIRALLEKMVQVSYQEVTLRSLIRIKDSLGDERFNEYIKYSGTGSSRKDFDLLCEVYDVQKANLNEIGAEGSPYHSKNYWNDFNQNIIDERGWRSDSEVNARVKQGEIIEDKVILETEIKLDSGPAITMQIHEESRQNVTEITDSEDDTRNGMGIVKVLTDDSEEEYGARRTPRRVRFGGEIVKMRTPDSDSNQPSDPDNDSTITITPRENGADKPLIEIHYSDSKAKKGSGVPKSHIPVSNAKKHKTAQSEPSSPTRGINLPKKRALFRSSPNLSKAHVFGEKVSNEGSKIPRRNPKQKSDKVEHTTTTIQIRLTDFRSKHKDAKNVKKAAKKSGEAPPNAPEGTQKPPAEEVKDKIIDDKTTKQTKLPKEDRVKPRPPPLKIVQNKVDNHLKKTDSDSSPIPAHKEIEMFHNLTRSPERRSSEPEIFNKSVDGGTINNNEEDFSKAVVATISDKVDNSSSSTINASKKSEIKNSEVEVLKTEPAKKVTNEERHLTTADKVLLNRDVKPVRNRNVHTADQTCNSGITPNEGLPNAGSSYNSFHVVPEPSNPADSPIPTNDNGDCLTCSSSGSDNLIYDAGWEEAGVIDKNIIANLKCKDDWKLRLRGLEELHRVLENQSSIEALEPKAASLFYFLFSCEQHSRLQSAAEDILKILFSNMKLEILRSRLNQIVMSLCKMGSPAGVRLSILLMRRISAEEFVDQLLGPTILGAKSSKIREGALQILMTISRIFPSTEVNVVKAIESITPLLHDRKKRVRRASLEAIAALAQLGTAGVVLDVISKLSASYTDKDQLMRAVRTRLSRKQLPSVDLNGSVRYSTPSGESEIEWISIGSASTSPHSTQHVVIERNTSSSVDIEDVSAAPVQTTPRTNYWKNNPRRVDTFNEEAKSFNENDSDWSANSVDAKDDLKAHNLQIWAVDPWTLSSPVKLSASNGTLRPLYIIQREQHQNSNSSSSPENYVESTANPHVRDQKRSPRGRSFSPPKKQADYGSKGEEPQRFINIAGEEEFVRNGHAVKLQKSSSSDHIRYNAKVLSPSTSSSNSGASIRNGNWHKNFKSGIPVPVSSDSRLRIRTKPVEAAKGPVSVPPQFYRTKTPSVHETPNRSLISQRSVLVRQPCSSGSESPEFYTPPAEPHLATNFKQPPPEEDVVLQSPRQSEGFVEVDTPRYHNENFTVIDDDSPPNVLDQNKSFVRVESETSQTEFAQPNTEEEAAPTESHFQKQDTVQSEDSFQAEVEFESEEVYHVPETLARDEAFERKEHFEMQITFERSETFSRQETFDESNITYQKYNSTNSLDDIETYTTPRNIGENRLISKSEVNLQDLPEVSRKSVNSAPALNEVIHHAHYETFDDSLNSTQTSIPGAVIDSIQEAEPEQLPEVPAKIKTPIKTPRTKSLSRKNSIRVSKKEVTPFPDTLRPFTRPKEGVNDTLALLEHNDWEMTMKGLQGVVRLTRHHPEVTEAHMHNLCMALGKHIRNLRSQVSRAACLAASELFTNHKKALEVGLEELAVPLLHRTADTNKFLRSDANAALDTMCLNLAPPRVVSVLATKGANHQNAIVRCTAARLLCSLTSRLGAERVFQLPKDTRDKILSSGANMLMEGNLETRKHAKMMFSNLSGHSQFNRAMVEAVPICTMRHIQKTLKSL